MKMRLNPDVFYLVKERHKTIEVRMYDDKRKQLKVGDYITFLRRPECLEEITVKVTKLDIYYSFDDVFDNCQLEDMGYTGITKGEFATIMNAHYPTQRGQVLAIHFELA